MSELPITFLGSEIVVGDAKITAPHPVVYAAALGSRVVVLYDPDSRLEKFGQFNNLVALTHAGEEIWEAELPTTMSGDSYYEVVSVSPLRARSVKSYECVIDPGTGRSLRRHS